MSVSGSRLLITELQPAAGADAVVLLAGELDTVTSADLREAVTGLAARRTRPARLVLDLSGVTYCDNASLYTLLGICHALGMVGITVVITGTAAVVREALHRNRLAERLPMQVKPTAL
ncbi:STAS domain-containing protein [Streptomyces sp. MMBL 11-3]|uniref:STAS domain-containing protein n=1 Tax=Streptomyces sp. MMBL 11-3 TaxID=3382639 RepID=UPI0039B39EB5